MRVHAQTHGAAKRKRQMYFTAPPQTLSQPASQSASDSGDPGLGAQIKPSNGAPSRERSFHFHTLSDVPPTIMSPATYL